MYMYTTQKFFKWQIWLILCSIFQLYNKYLVHVYHGISGLSYHGDNDDNRSDILELSYRAGVLPSAEYGVDEITGCRDRWHQQEDLWRYYSIITHVHVATQQQSIRPNNNCGGSNQSNDRLRAPLGWVQVLDSTSRADGMHDISIRHVSSIPLQSTKIEW